MAFYPHVNPGDTFQPGATLENNIRDCVNAFHCYGARPQKGAFPNAIRVTVYNQTNEVLPAGCAVALNSDSEVHTNGVLPCEKFVGDNRPWGVLVSELPPRAVGDCVIAGVVSINLIGNGHPGDGVMPVILDDGKEQKYAAIPGGNGFLLSTAGENSAVLLGTTQEYYGYFKVVLTKQALINGDGNEDHSSDVSPSDDTNVGFSGNGILGLVNGELILYPIGNCGGDDVPPEDDIPPEDDTRTDSDEEELSPTDDWEDGKGVVLAVIDGANPVSNVCGFIDMGRTRHTISKTVFTNWKQRKNLYVSLQGCSIRLSANYPVPTHNHFVCLLGRLIYRNGAYSVVQEQHGAIINHMIPGGL